MRIIAVFVLLFSGSQALAEVSGSICCMVKSNTVVSIFEGVTKKYTCFKDRFEMGDKLIFEYSAVRFPSDPLNTIILCGLKDKIRGDDVFGAVHFTGFDPKYDAIILQDLRGVGVNSKKFAGDYLRFREDLFICEGPEGDLLLNRYYKSDCKGVFTSRSVLIDLTAQIASVDLTAQIATFDCHKIENNVQKVFDLSFDK